MEDEKRVYAGKILETLGPFNLSEGGSYFKERKRVF